MALPYHIINQNMKEVRMLFEYETERLNLKIIKPMHANQVLDFYLRDQELFERFEPDRAEGFYTVGFQKQILSFEYNMAVQGTLFRFYVYEKTDPKRIIGTISFHHIVRGFSNSCEIGYKFSSEVHHRGYATEALTKVLEVIFYELQLHRVQAWVLPDNAPSIRLLERVGFVFEGISRDYLFLHGTWQSHALYSILPSDLQTSSWHNQ